MKTLLRIRPSALELFVAALGIFPACSNSSDSSRDRARDAEPESELDATRRDTEEIPEVEEIVPDVEELPLVHDTTPREEECQQLESTGVRPSVPVDIIWAVDTSGSMKDEAELLQTGIIDFVRYFDELNLDWRVVMIANPCGSCLLDVCVPPPLSGAPGCPDTDSTKYKHVRNYVDSNDSLRVIATSLPEYTDFLRADSVKHVVVVTDDQSALPLQAYRDSLRGTALESHVFHSIVSTEGACVGPYGGAVAEGTLYEELSAETDGTVSSICQEDWSQIFDAIADSVQRGAVIPCEFLIPAPPFGTISYDSVTVDFTPEGRPPLSLERVDTAADCSTGLQWYYDNNEVPQYVLLCEDACGDRIGTLSIHIGCIKG